MRDEFLPFSRPSIDEGDIAAVCDVLRSGWITTGSRAAAFEEACSQYTGSPHSVALSSATAGMHVALHALGIGPGDEVITPSMTWVSTVNLITLAGATPVFADIDNDTLMITPEQIAERVTDRTRAVIPVHFAGTAADMQPIRALADTNGIAIIEDAAHALGTTYRDELIGRRGTAVFSFHPIKNITTAEGGMVCSDDERIAERVRRLKFHGLGVDAHDRQVQGRAPQAEVQEPGYKYNLPDVLAALGIRQLARVDDTNRTRAALAHRYLELLADVDEVLPLHMPEYPTTHAWHLFVVRLDVEKAGMTRDAFMAALKERNIGTGFHFKAVHLQKYYREHSACPRGSLPRTEWNSDRICSLPLFPEMTGDDVDDVVRTIKDVLAG